MYYAGIDYHKRYSIVSIQNEQGQIVQEQRVDHAFPELFGGLFRECPEPVSVVYESTINWSWLYEILQPQKNVSSITLANPFKARQIAEAQIKTDKISARALATLLRLNVVPACHIPDQKTRHRKEVLRQRSYWVKMRTALRCRVHKILGNQHNLSMPQVTDLFGRKGRTALDKARLPEPDQSLLHQNLDVLDALDEEIGADEQLIRKAGKADRVTKILSSMPGIALILANVIATETDGIGRFRDRPHYTSYSGLSPTVHSSGGKTRTGRMVPQCNRWLKWAYVEAAWVAVGCSPYFGGLYRYHRGRGKQANTAITIVARRMCHVAYQLLTEDRMYKELPFSPAALVKG
jgi:transposase